jgi:metallophosphoesterase (TIGR00282 family)
VKVLFIGDVVGRPGREAVRDYLQSRCAEGDDVDLVIANGENLAGGKGITPEVAEEMFASGVNVITGGNHIWANRDVFKFIDTEQRLLRPANYPEGVPGRGAGVFTDAEGVVVGVVNLLGRTFMESVDCPFRIGRREVTRLREKTSIILIDLHAEATSEKNAIGWFFDGEVSAVVGTHTHIPTADERILPRGTAFITDVGMTGPYDSVIGVKKDVILRAFQTCLPVKHEVAKGDVHLCGVEIEIDPASGLATSIRRIVNPPFSAAAASH